MGFLENGSLIVARQGTAALADQRRLRDPDLWRGLDLSHPPLNAVRAALKMGDEAAARAALVRHFRTRNRPKMTKFRTDPHWSDWGAWTLLRRADQLCGHRIVESEHKIVDARGGAKEAGGIDWSKALAAKHTAERQGLLPTLAEAWARTHKARYAQALERWARSHIECLPFVLDKEFHKESFAAFGGKAHPQLGSCYVIFHWADVLDSDLFRAQGMLSEEFCFHFLKHFWFLAHQFTRFLGASWRADNHHLMERGTATYFLGVQFPEFKQAAAMERYGREIIVRHFDHNVLADGVGSEHCTSYQYRCFIRFALPDSVARANGRDLLGAARRKRLLEWLEFQGFATAPDGRQPDVGDGHGTYLDEVAAQSGALYRSSALKGIVRRLSLKPEVNPAYAAAWRATKARAPHETSRLYVHSGHLLLRDGWSPEANFLWMGIKNESLYNIHTHWDTFDFTLCAHGKRLIGDPNGRTYGKPKGLARGYYFSMDAHNTLVIDDDILTSYRTLQDAWGLQPPRITCAAASFGPDVDYATFEHAGYRPLFHRRDVVFVRGRYWLMTDGIRMDFDGFNTVFASEGDIRPHRYRQQLHFEAGVKAGLGPQPGSLVTKEPRGPNVLVVPEPFENLKAGVIRDAYLDALKHHDARDCLIGEIHRQTIGACFFSTLYRPFMGAKAPAVRVESLTPRATPFRNDTHHAVLIRDGAFTDLWFTQRDLHRPKLRKLNGHGFELETDAASLFVSLKAGRPATVFCIGGRVAKLNGRQLAARPHRLSWHKRS